MMQYIAFAIYRDTKRSSLLSRAGSFLYLEGDDNEKNTQTFLFDKYRVIYFTGTPLKVSDYIVNPIKKVLSVRISKGLGHF